MEENQKAEPEKDRQNPRVLLTGAEEFASAARILRDHAPHRSNLPSHFHPPSTVICYLMAHTFELLFKSYLRSQGYSLDKLKNTIGHNLERALRHANHAGLDSLVKLSEEQEACLALIGDYYVHKELDYRHSQTYHLPPWAALWSLYETLHPAIFRAVEATGREQS